MNASELNDIGSFLFRILVAALLGGLLGLERDIHGRGAGLRTHLLVSVGSAVFMILSIRVESFGVGLDPNFMRVTDPGRIAAQIVTGIGFLGAGVIIKVGLSVRGLTTAACLWVAAAIGMAAGGRVRPHGGGHLRDRARRTDPRCASSRTSTARTSTAKLILTVPIDTELSRVLAVVRARGLQIMFYCVDRDYDHGTTVVRLSLGLFHKGNIEDLTERIIAEIEGSGLPLKRLDWRMP